MADIDSNAEMASFHRTEVTLCKSDQDEMRSRRDAGRTRLETGLDVSGHSRPSEVASQGSYAMRTMVQDDECDYDIDDGAYFAAADLNDENGEALSPLAVRQRVCEALKWDGRLKHDAEVKRNCVRQAYPQGYHIDVPVYRIVTTYNAKGEKDQHNELASGDDWVHSDARAVTGWYADLVGELNAGESDGSQMRRITKLTKKLARSRLDWKAKTTSGICITKLVTDHFAVVAARDDQALRKTWISIESALDESTAIAHPVFKDVNLAEEGDSEVIFFQECIGDALNKLEVLDSSDCTRSQARTAWDDVFDTTFFSDQPDNNAEAKKAAVTVTSVQTARRNDGGGRFG